MKLSDAPVTSSMSEAVSLSLGAVEQEIQEAIAEGRVGFKGGWVSSLALATLLEQLRAVQAAEAAAEPEPDPTTLDGDLLERLGTAAMHRFQVVS